MALSTQRQMANRFGLDLDLYDLDDTIGTDEPLLTIDFANSCEISLDGEKVWATGFQDHKNVVGFCNALRGTLTVSTQMMTKKLLMLMAGKKPMDGTNVIIFDNISDKPVLYFQMRGRTVWQDTDGGTHSETITLYKIAPRLAVNITYNGEGDPLSADIVFDILPTAYGRVMKTIRDYPSAILVDNRGYRIEDSQGRLLYAPLKGAS